jgi:hypothetical protein
MLCEYIYKVWLQSIETEVIYESNCMALIHSFEEHAIICTPCPGTLTAHSIRLVLEFYVDADLVMSNIIEQEDCIKLCETVNTVTEAYQRIISAVMRVEFVSDRLLKKGSGPWS